MCLIEDVGKYTRFYVAGDLLQRLSMLNHHIPVDLQNPDTRRTLRGVCLKVS